MNLQAAIRDVIFAEFLPCTHNFHLCIHFMAPTKKPIKRFSPPKEALEHARAMAPAVIGYDWSVHCVGSQTDQDAKDEHLMSLRNEHGHSWSGVGSRLLPS